MKESREKNNVKSWHQLTIEKTLIDLKSSKEGLSDEEAKFRLSVHGPNEITSAKKESTWKLFAEQFLSLLIIILIVAAVVSASIGQMVEAITIIVIVILAGILGFVQEYQAGKAIEALKKMAAPNATVIRGGKEKVIPASEIVPGDLIVLQAGDKIPADARLISSKNFKVDEAALTGESHAVLKTDKVIDGEKSSPGDLKNMVFMGTAVTFGRAVALVVATGMKTEFGKIAELLQSTEKRRTPLQRNLDTLGRKLGVYSIILAAVMSVLGILEGYPLVEMFVWGVAIAVAVIPEALPAVVTISIALGVKRMVKRKALIRKLPAVETLGATNIICTDKTGTLTQDQMTIQKVVTSSNVYDVTGAGYTPEGKFLNNGNEINPENDSALMQLLTAGSLCNDTVLTKEEGHYTIIGDPTEGAIVVCAEKAGINVQEIRKSFVRIDEIPFSSETKKMTTLNTTPYGNIAYTKGAPEIIIRDSAKIFVNGEEKILTEEDKKYFLEKSEELSKNALRVLGIAFKNVGEREKLEEDDREEMVLLGIVGMMDLPRPEVKEAIKTCERASIKPIMITGDHITTAVAIAKELGIMKNGGSITGDELEKLSFTEMNDIVEHTDVYARISPTHKLKIVQALMNKGNIVAMTGDGVNDAPALKKADIGIAMGIKGTEVSREAADMILTDDNFASIVAAVEEGRSIFENIRKYLVYLLSGNLGAVLALVAALLFVLPIPLTAVQILFINFLMDGLIAIALGLEPPEEGIMNKKPRNVKEGILNKRALITIGAIGLWIAIVAEGVFLWGLKNGASGNAATTYFFVTLIFARLFNGLNCRSFDTSIFKMDFFSNKSLITGIVISITVTLLVTEIPLFHVAFDTAALSLKDWAVSFFAASTTLLFGEILKIFFRKKVA